jgi:hypothetical protein
MTFASQIRWPVEASTTVTTSASTAISVQTRGSVCSQPVVPRAATSKATTAGTFFLIERSHAP